MFLNNGIAWKLFIHLNFACSALSSSCAIKCMENNSRYLSACQFKSIYQKNTELPEKRTIRFVCLSVRWEILIRVDITFLRKKESNAILTRNRIEKLVQLTIFCRICQWQKINFQHCFTSFFWPSVKSGRESRTEEKNESEPLTADMPLRFRCLIWW